ncbi:MAG: hypothetical protein FD123_1294 [Bacteroidetes bacterium]|nr:MAG: hypothetical protein FD123_1294 [Bacteroidota bacterium]
MKQLLAALSFSLLLVPSLKAQDLDSMMNATDDPGKREYVSATFKTTRVVNAQTIETAKKGTLDFRITHRFGNMGTASNGGGHTLWGFDDSRDIRFSFDYGVTENLAIGIGRSKINELLDGSVKWSFLRQTLDNKIPLTITLYSTAGVTPVKEAQVYSNVTLDSGFVKKFAHRASYTTQLVIARKFSQRFSFELIPGYTHRNFVKALDVNPDNSATDENDLISAGAAFRFKLSKRVAIVAEYFYLFSDYRRGNPDYFDPIGVGVEIETGGHVFHINLTNAAGINENNFLPYTTDNWAKGGYKLGFNISRAFAMGGKKKDS